MLSQQQSVTIANFFQAHPNSILWRGDAAEFVLQPTRLTQSIVTEALNNPKIWQQAAQMVQCPLRFQFSQPYLKVVLHHSFTDLEVEAEMFGYSTAKWKIEDEYVKPKLQLPWWSSFLHISYLFWQTKYLQPSQAFELVAEIDTDFKKFLNIFDSTKEKLTLNELVDFFQKGLSFILALGILDGLYEQYVQEILRKKHQDKWTLFEKNISVLVKKDDEYFKSIHDLGIIGEDEKKLEEYLKNYGVRSFDDYELSSPRFHEIKEKIKNIAKTGSANVTEKNQIVDLSFFNPNEKEIIKISTKVKSLRGTFRLKLLVVVDELRQSLLQFAHEKKIEEEDLFFHSIEELLTPFKRDSTQIKKRQLSYEQDKKIQLPMLLTASNWKNIFLEDKQTSGVKMKIVPVSLGEATGRVVVVSEELDFEVSKGSILILPDSSPKYTHLYPTAKALIFQQGGMMSHGAIVAREYHIPAVSLSGKPHPFKMNEEVIVDATKGFVAKLEN